MTVPRFELERRHRHQSIGVNLWHRGSQELELVGLRIKQIVVARISVAINYNDRGCLIIGLSYDPDLLPRERLQ